METVTDWVAGLSYRELKERCDLAGLPVTTTYSMKDIFEDPHYAARKDIIEVPCEDFGTMRMPNVFPFLSETPGRVKWPGPAQGSYNQEIYGGLLGYSEEKIAHLKQINVI